MMRKILLALALLWSLMTQAERTVAPEISRAEEISAPSLSQTGQVSIPNLHNRVTDTTGTLSAESVATLTRTLVHYEQASGHQLAVLLVDTTGEETIEQYATRVFDSWKLGDEKRDDGLLLIVAKADHTIRIEVGYGLESTLTDLQASQVINRDMVPYFKGGDYNNGIRSGVDALVRISTDPSFAESYIESEAAPDQTESDSRLTIWLFSGLMIMAILPAVVFRKFGPVRRCVFSSLAMAAITMVISRDLIITGFGFLAFLVIYFFTTFGSWQGSGGRGGGRSRRRGSSNSGGGDSGDGFSGGGGSSGGGGASGRW